MVSKFSSTFFSLSAFILLILIGEAVTIQLDLQEGEELKGNNVDGSQLNQCLSVSERNEIGVCFGKELLNKLNGYEEAEAFSLANGVSFVRDEKTPRDIGSFLDRDPMDFRSIMEDASNLISKRSLHWDLSIIYPGLVMRIGPTLANGILEFVIDPRIKDRSFQQQEVSTGRLLSRNLLVPVLLGLKFHISTLLPLLLGLLLLASKKAFLLAKLALFAVTVFSSAGAPYSGQNIFGNLGSSNSGSFTRPSTPSSVNYQNYLGSAGFYRDHKHFPDEDYFYNEKSSEPSTASPITPDELRDRLERLFITKKDNSNEKRDDMKMRKARNFAWTPITGG